MWPFLIIHVVDKADEGKLFGKSGCEKTYITIPLLDYADKIILPDKDRNYAKAQFMRNQDELSYVQEQKQMPSKDDFAMHLEEQAEREAKDNEKGGDAAGGIGMPRRTGVAGSIIQGQIKQGESAGLQQRDTVRKTMANGVQMNQISKVDASRMGRGKQEKP